jgi:hypothetical protein
VAQPTFTSITPGKGYTGGGQIVEIVGTNFRALEVPYAVPEMTERPTVAVTFGGAEAEAVWPVSTTLLRVRVPTAQFDPNPDIEAQIKLDPDITRISFGAVDVVITNLDDNHVPIPGETVTAPDVYVYQQPLLRLPEGDPPLLQVLREFLQLLKLTLVPRVAWTSHSDYGDDEAFFTALSTHPSVGLRLEFPDDIEYSHYDNVPQQFARGVVWDEYAMQKTVMMVASLTLSASSSGEVLRMVTALLDLQMATPWLIVPPDPRYPIAIPSNRYPLELSRHPAQVGSVNRVNVTAFTAQLRVRGIPVVHGDVSTKSIRRRMVLKLATSSMQGQQFAVTTV